MNAEEPESKDLVERIRRRAEAFVRKMGLSGAPSGARKGNVSASKHRPARVASGRESEIRKRRVRNRISRESRRRNRR